MVWVDEIQAAFWRFTANTPYGWYTFDIETMERRPVNTAPGSWDTINLWGSEAMHSLHIGVAYYNSLYVPLPPDIAPWPPFDPWTEVVPMLEAPPVPGPFTSSRRFLEPAPAYGWGVSGYMRLTCE